jgi:GAF domain-containing protein
VDREAAVIRSLVEMADTLVSDFDVVDLLTGLTDHCVELLDISAAGVLLMSPEGDLRPVASSNEAVHLLELFELQAMEGPCLEAYESGEMVAQVQFSGATRWPRFAAKALDVGFQSVMAFPLRLREKTIGALITFGVGQAEISGDDVLVACAFADLAAMSILQYRATLDTRRLNEQLTHALNSRIVIEQAKGVIAERMQVDLEESFNRLRRYARNHGMPLTQVAQSAIENSLDTAALIAAAPPTGNGHGYTRGHDLD